MQKKLKQSQAPIIIYETKKQMLQTFSLAQWKAGITVEMCQKKQSGMLF